MCFYTGDLVSVDGMITLWTLVRGAEAFEAVLEFSTGNINCSGMHLPRF